MIADQKKYFNKYKETLKHSRITEFIDYTDYPAFLFDSTGNLLYSNQHNWNQFQFSEDFISELNSSYFLFNTLIEKKQQFAEKNYYLKNSNVLIERKSKRIYLDDTYFFLEHFKPVTTKDSSIEVNKDLEIILDSVQEGICIFDERGYAVRINKIYSELTGLNKEELEGMHVSEHINKGYYDESVTLEVLKKRKPVSILQKIEDQIWLVSGKPIFNSRNEIKGSVNTVYDMTELNNLRKSLKLQALAISEQNRNLEILRSQVFDIPGVIMKSSIMKELMERIMRISTVDTSVFILGETGCGKSLFAKLIHKKSNRSNMNFIEVNCGALPENLAESELFGYENGAFTGASRGGKKGLIEAAHKGTLFLDEIGDMPLNLQVKLLSFLQEKKIRRVGGTSEIKVDVRVIAATNKDIKALISEKKFREDLYYRLSVVTTTVPPLRKRKEDIFGLSTHFLSKYNNKYNRNVKISKDVFLCLENYDWPGNVRELEHTIEQLVVLSYNESVYSSDLPSNILNLSNDENKKNLLDKTLKDIVDDIERDAIIESWKMYKDINVVAEKLGVHRTTLTRKVNKLNINLPMS